MKAIIEIPKGDTIRRHLAKDKSGFVEIGPIKDVIPVNNGVNPVHYGYIPGTFNPSDDDEIDVIVLSKKEFRVGEEVEVVPIALIKREDRDDKVVAVDESLPLVKNWEDVLSEERKLIEEFYSYHYKIVSIESAEAAEKYIRSSSNI